MTHLPFRRTLRFARRAVAALAAAHGALFATAANHTQSVQPIATGRFAVACSNVEQDPALIAQFGGTPPEDFWEGKPANGQLRYISQILSFPETAVVIAPEVPPTPALYRQFAGQQVTHVAIVCYPTPRANTDPDYVLPQTADRIPRMQPPGTAPKLIRIAEHAAGYGIFFSPPPPDVAARLPLIVFSHGLGGSPISPGYIEAMTELASQGYMVGAIFHGDARFSRVRLDDLGDLLFLFTEFGKFAEMQLMRPLSLKALTDHLLSRPEYAAGIDSDRIGAFGTSMGGQSVANLVGARLTTSIDRNCSATVRDPRIKAAVGYVPYAGQSFLPSFCDGQSGAADVARPYLAIAGRADTTAPIEQIRQAVNRMGDSRYLVELAGVPHEYLDEYRGDVFTWAVNFLNTYLVPAFDPQAVNRLIVQRDVAGGPLDQLTIDRHVPFRVLPGEAVAFEFHEPGTDQYRYSADPLRQFGPGWEPTDFSFKVYPGLPGEIDSVPMRRTFAGNAQAGGIFPGANPEGETGYVPRQRAKRAGGWFDQALGFHARAPLPDGTCPAGYLQLLRAAKPGVPSLDANRRFTTSDSEASEMARRGWRLEGVEFCVLP